MYAAIRQGKARAGMAEELASRIKEGVIPLVARYIHFERIIVIPAQAGSLGSSWRLWLSLDSRLRGNDKGFNLIEARYQATTPGLEAGFKSKLRRPSLGCFALLAMTIFGAGESRSSGQRAKD